MLGSPLGVFQNRVISMANGAIGGVENKLNRGVKILRGRDGDKIWILKRGAFGVEDNVFKQ